MSMGDTIAAIREQGGIVYLPHPFDRLHTIPDAGTLHRHLAEIDVFEVYNARLLFEGFNDEALRFARKYNLTMGAGSDAHVLQGVGTGLVRLRAFETAGGVPHQPAQRRDRPAAEVAPLPPGPEVGRAGARAPHEGIGPVGGGRGDPEYRPRPRASVRRRHLRALPEEGDRRDQRARPRDRPGGRPRAGARARLRPPARRHLPPEARAADRGDPRGRRVLRPLRTGGAEVDPAPARRPDGDLRDELRQVRGRRTTRTRTAGSRASCTSCSRRSSWSWGKMRGHA